MSITSVIIPVYNNLTTLPATLESVARLADRSRVELIVSDDKSTDGTRDFLESWFAAHSGDFAKARLILNPKNLGISGNHKVAFEAATGEYGFYLGGDDILFDPLLVSNIERALAASPGTRIAKIDIDAFHPHDARVERLYEHKLSFFGMSSRSQFASLALFGDFLYAGPGTVMHIPTLRAIGGGFDERFRTYEDLPLYYNFLIRGYRIRFLPVKGLYWVRAKTSVSRSGFGAMRERFELENDMAAEIYVYDSGLLTAYERLLLRAKAMPKYARYLLFTTSLSWLRCRLIPSIMRKTRAIARRA
jgi:glycosyltransferase involved in cell wall biosynthesis